LDIHARIVYENIWTNYSRELAKYRKLQRVKLLQGLGYMPLQNTYAVKTFVSKHNGK
jgi:hypothetical protein